MIVYLHGFSSGAASRKATILKQALAPIPLIIPEYPAHQARTSLAMLTQLIRRQKPQGSTERLMLIGSSLGGYYAQYLAITLRIIDGVVLINPALQPQLTLQPYIGQQTNLVTGELFKFRQQEFDELAQFDVPGNAMRTPTLVLLDEGDDVIDYQYAARRYRNAGRIIVYPGGSHWFDHLHEAIPEIRTFYQSLR